MISIENIGHWDCQCPVNFQARIYGSLLIEDHKAHIELIIDFLIACY